MTISAIDKNFPGIPVNKDNSNKTPATSSSIEKSIGIISLFFPNKLFTDLPNCEISELKLVIPTIPMAMNINAKLSCTKKIELTDFFKKEPSMNDFIISC